MAFLKLALMPLLAVLLAGIACGPSAAAEQQPSPQQDVAPSKNTSPAQFTNTPEAEVGELALRKNVSYLYRFTDENIAEQAHACKRSVQNQTRGGELTYTILDGTVTNGQIQSIVYKIAAVNNHPKLGTLRASKEATVYFSHALAKKRDWLGDPITLRVSRIVC